MPYKELVLRYTLVIEGGCSQAGVGCRRLLSRGSAPPACAPWTSPPRAPVRLLKCREGLESSAPPNRAPRPSPPRAPACSSTCLCGRPRCWSAAPALCAGVEGECRRRSSNPLPKDGLDSNGCCLSCPPLPLRLPALATRESDLPNSCSRVDELLPSRGPLEAGGLGVPGLVVLWRRWPPGGGRVELGVGSVVQPAGERASAPRSPGASAPLLPSSRARL
jgi:hypothetical protein